MIWIIVNIIGFIFGLITPLTHILGFVLLYHLQTRLVNQKMILMNFSIITILGSLLYTIKRIFCYVYKGNVYLVAQYFLHTNGLFIGCGLYYTLLLFILTVDRLIITMKPFKYSKIFSRRSCSIALKIIGAMTVVIAGLLLAYLNRNLHVLSYILALTTTGILSLFNLISYIFIFYKIKIQLSRVSMKTRPENKGKRSRRKTLVPLMINISLLVFFFIPHTLMMLYRKKLGYLKVSSLGMAATNIGLFADALIYILNTNTRKILVQKLETLGCYYMFSKQEESLRLAKSKYTLNKSSLASVDRV